MSRKRKSVEEKVKILKEAEVSGVVVTCRKYGVDNSTYYTWKERYEEEGISGLKPRGRNQVDPELRVLREENERLKKLVAEKELALQVKDELLKKVSQRGRKR